MKQIIIIILTLFSVNAYSQTLYIPTNADSLKLPIQVNGAVRSIYVTDLNKTRVSITKHIADSSTLRGLINTNTANIASNTAAIANKVNKDSAVQYTLSNSRNNDLLKYDSANSKFVNFRTTFLPPLIWDYSIGAASVDTNTAVTGLVTKGFFYKNASAGGSSTTGDVRAYLGRIRLDSLYNFTVGNGSAAAPASGYANFIGYDAGSGATGAAQSNMFGFFAGLNATNALTSNFFGTNAGRSATNATLSNFMGSNAGNGATGAEYSNFIGNAAGQNASSAPHSNFMGANAGKGATSATFSNFIGEDAGLNATGAGSSNFFGRETGVGATGAAYSTFIGYNVGNSGTHAITGQNNIVIGMNITTPTAATQNSLNIGNVLYGLNMYAGYGGNPQTAAQTTGLIGIDTNTPNSTFHVNGSFASAYTAKTAAYTATSTDYTINCNGTFTVTLPTAVAITGRIYVIKNSGSGTITMAGTSAQTFDGTASPTIAAGSVNQYQSDGANWIKIN